MEVKSVKNFPNFRATTKVISEMLALVSILLVANLQQVPPEIVADGSDLTFLTAESGDVYLARQDSSGRSKVATVLDVAGALLEAEDAADVKIALAVAAAMEGPAKAMAALDAKVSRLEETLTTTALKAEQLTSENKDLRDALTTLSDAVDTVQDSLGDAPDVCEEYDVQNGVVSGHGLFAGAVRLFVCEDGYILQGPLTAVCTDTGAWSGVVTECVATTSTTTATATTTTTSTTTLEPAQWKLVFRQKNCAFPSAVNGSDSGSEDDDCYSKWSSIADYNQRSKYTFKLNWPQKRNYDGASDDGPEVIFSQTTNPVTTLEKVGGYKQLSRTEDESRWWTLKWKGLVKSSFRGTFLDGNPGGNWHYALGSSTREFPGGSWANRGSTYADDGVCTGGKALRSVYETCWAELYIRTN